MHVLIIAPAVIVCGKGMIFAVVEAADVVVKHFLRLFFWAIYELFFQHLIGIASSLASRVWEIGRQDMASTRPPFGHNKSRFLQGKLLVQV